MKIIHYFARLSALLVCVLTATSQGAPKIIDNGNFPASITTGGSDTLSLGNANLDVWRTGSSGGSNLWFMDTGAAKVGSGNANALYRTFVVSGDTAASTNFTLTFDLTVGLLTAADAELILGVYSWNSSSDIAPTIDESSNNVTRTYTLGTALNDASNLIMTGNTSPLDSIDVIAGSSFISGNGLTAGQSTGTYSINLSLPANDDRLAVVFSGRNKIGSSDNLSISNLQVTGFGIDPDPDPDPDPEPLLPDLYGSPLLKELFLDLDIQVDTGGQIAFKYKSNKAAALAGFSEITTLSTDLTQGSWNPSLSLPVKTDLEDDYEEVSLILESDEDRLFARLEISIGTANFYVSDSGNDKWSGTLPAPNLDATDGPFATLQKAVEVLRELDTPQADEVLVLIREGRYDLDASDAKALADAASVGSGVTVDTFPGEKPTITRLQHPNIIVILTDDQGYADLGSYGAPDIKTPEIDKMADEGIRLTSFYVSRVCSPTRSSLMTGQTPPRGGQTGVLGANNFTDGLDPERVTIAELLKAEGYATALIGKWHLGLGKHVRPTQQGFDYWYGTPGSNNSAFYGEYWEFAEDCVYGDGFSAETAATAIISNCALVREYNDDAIPAEVIEFPAHQFTLTRRYTQQTIDFITAAANQDQPFFVYLAHNMPHGPVETNGQAHVFPEWLSDPDTAVNYRVGIRGSYGDFVQEVDWSVGQVLQALEDLGIDDNTIVVFFSDNGPAGGGDGSAFPLRDTKGSVWEDGVRVPCIWRWPGKLPAGQVNDQPLWVSDVMPTMVTLGGGDIPTDRVIDGRDILPILTGVSSASSPHDAIYNYAGRALGSVRAGDWKLMLGDTDQLFNLNEDIGEQNDLLLDQPGNQEFQDIAAMLRAMFEAFDLDVRTNR